MSPDKTAIEKLWDKHSYDFELWGVRHRIMNQAGFLAALSEAEGERWISVEERLPVTGSPCWIVYAARVQSIAYRRVGMGFDCCDGYIWETAYELDVEEIPDDEVTHWQPLPAPPKEKP